MTITRVLHILYIYIHTYIHTCILHNITYQRQGSFNEKRSFPRLTKRHITPTHEKTIVLCCASCCVQSEITLNVAKFFLPWRKKRKILYTDTLAGLQSACNFDSWSRGDPSELRPGRHDWPRRLAWEGKGKETFRTDQSFLKEMSATLSADWCQFFLAWPSPSLMSLFLLNWF